MSAELEGEVGGVCTEIAVGAEKNLGPAAVELLFIAHSLNMLVV